MRHSNWTSTYSSRINIQSINLTLKANLIPPLSAMFSFSVWLPSTWQMIKKTKTRYLFTLVPLKLQLGKVLNGPHVLNKQQNFINTKIFKKSIFLWEMHSIAKTLTLKCVSNEDEGWEPTALYQRPFTLSWKRRIVVTIDFHE